MGGARVFVGNLSSRANERDLENFFRGFGRIREVMVKNGFGFVEFDDERDAEDAVYEQNGRELLGERVVVEISRRDRPSGSAVSGFRGGFSGRGGYGRGGGYGGRGGSFGVGGGFGGRGGGFGGFRGGGPPRFNNRYGPPIQTRYRLLVYNLSTRCSWQDLKDLMRNAGEVTYADAHKRVRNEAVVCFASHEDLKRAIDKYQGKDINGRRIKLVDDSDGYSGGGRHSRSRSRSRSRSAHRSRSRSRASRSRSPAENGRSRSPSRSRSRSPSTTSKKSGSPQD